MQRNRRCFKGGELAFLRTPKRHSKPNDKRASIPGSETLIGPDGLFGVDAVHRANVKKS